MATFDTYFEMEIFRQRERAEEAVDRLHELGYSRDDIGVIKRSKGDATPLVAGPLAAALASHGAGADGDGIAGALIGLGVAENRAKEYEKEIREGAILIAVLPKSKERRAEVRRALGEIRAVTGEIERSLDYAGERYPD